MSVNEKMYIPSFAARCPNTLDSSEPVAKRTRSAYKKKVEKIPKVADISRVAILDVLNEDCWSIVFDYVSLVDLVRSETTCKHWCSIVQRYLKGIRLRLRVSRFARFHNYEPPFKKRILCVEPEYLRPAVQKFSSCVIAAYCSDSNDFNALRRHCPNLEDLKIIFPPHLLKYRDVPFEKLKAVSFINALYFNDRHFSKYLAKDTQEDLWVYNNPIITGTCLTQLQSNLKSIQLDSCSKLDIDSVLSAVEHLTDLTKLSLKCNSRSILTNAYKLIERTPKLEILSLEWYRYQTEVGALVNAICGLSMLRQLSLSNNDSVCDDWLERIGRCCKNLRIVEIARCENVTAAGVTALCRGVGNTLERLDVSNNGYIADDEAIRFIITCPKLEMLNVHSRCLASPSLPAAVAAALAAEAAAASKTHRPRPMTLKVHMSIEDPNVPRIDEYLPNLILDFNFEELTPWIFH